MNLEEQARNIRMFHDGKITNLMRQAQEIRFTVRIPFLAKLINEDYSWFGVLFKECNSLHYRDEELGSIFDIGKIDSFQLEILNASVKDGCVNIFCICNKRNKNGELIFSSKEIVFYDEGGCEISDEKLTELFNRYWY
jgi:hypothetical protein